MRRPRKGKRMSGSRPQLSLTIEHADNATSALKRLRELRLSNRFDIFRGQRQPWPAVSKVARLSSAERPDAVQRINRFAFWAAEIAVVQELVDDPLRVLAVAQHYGIATAFIDFTTNPDVAYFFATQSAQSSASACRVLCGSSVHVEEELAAVRHDIGKPFPRVVRISVNNLWRLEAQEGLFVDLPFPADTPLESIIHLHAIDFFPDQECASPIPPERIYPTRKSALELQLDQYFREEYVQQGLKQAREMGVEIETLRWEENIHAFKSCELPAAHSSWANVANQQWLTMSPEPFAQTVDGKAVAISLPTNLLPVENIRAHFEESLLGHLKKGNLRRSAVAFDLSGDRPAGSKSSATMVRAMEVFWDGVRRLPYTDAEISLGFGVLATLLWLALSEEESYMESLLGDLIEIECYSQNWVHFRAPVSKQGLEEALRADIREELDLSVYPVLSDPLSVIDHLHDVQRLFDFPSFRKLMISELIPGQIIERFDTTGQYGSPDLVEIEPDWVVFNPFHVTYLRSATYFIGQEQRIRNRDRRISLHLDCTVEDLKVLAWETRRRIAQGSRPGTVTFAGFPELDRKEVFEIPEVKTFCQSLMNIGFVSILEVATSLSFLVDSYDPYTLGAFEIWLLAQGLMKKTTELEEIRRMLVHFFELLPEINRTCEALFPDGTTYSEERVAEANLIGVIGRGRANFIHGKMEARK
jgi:FRG domain